MKIFENFSGSDGKFKLIPNFAQFSKGLFKSIPIYNRCLLPYTDWGTRDWGLSIGDWDWCWGLEMGD